MTRLRILNTERHRYSAGALTLLGSLGDVTNVDADRQYLLDHVADYDVLLIALKNTIDREVLERAKNLKFLVTPTTGLNHIDMQAAAERNVSVVSLKGEVEFLNNITATAELTWGLLLAVLRKIPSAFHDVAQHQWRRDRFQGNELKGKVLGIIGYGRLGKMVGDYAGAFRMKVLAHDTETGDGKPDISFVEMDELLARSEIISVHLPLNEETRGFLDESCFQRMKEGVVIINTARGELIDEQALLDGLLSGKVKAAALDVLAEEVSLDPDWLRKSPLISYANENDNLIITPHVGGCTNESVGEANLFIIRKLEENIRNSML